MRAEVMIDTDECIGCENCVEKRILITCQRND